MTMRDQDHDDDVTPSWGSPPTDGDMVHGRAELAAEADEAGLLDVAYRLLDTPVGPLLLAATPVGLVRVAYEREDLSAVLDRLATKISRPVLSAPKRLDHAARQLDEYFSGPRRQFDLPIDMRLSSGFRRAVLAYLPAIDYARTASYQAVAAAVDNPKAVRAVGSACATNPLPLVIPCHRVIRADGAVGAYLGGSEIKHQLLAMEASRVSRPAQRCD
jgi:methylated-DNA-[protein]-cysteine S-methyltransferase